MKKGREKKKGLERRKSQLIRHEGVYRKVIDSLLEEFRSSGHYYDLILKLSWGLEVFDEIRKGANPEELWVKYSKLKTK